MATKSEIIKNAPAIIVWQLLRLLNSLYPIDDKCILLEGNKSYEDSARSLFEELIKRGANKDYRIIWYMDDPDSFHYLEENDNVQVKKYRSWRNGLSNFSEILSFVADNCRSRYVLYCNSRLGYRLRPGQVRVYLTHGIALKELRGALTNPKGLSLIVSPSEFTSNLIEKAMPGTRHLTKVLGLPRNDSLWSVDERSCALLDRFKGKKRIIWMPTFKRNVTAPGAPQRNDYAKEVKKDVSLLSAEFMQRVNSVLDEENAVLFIKFHPFQNLEYIDFYQLSNIVTLKNRDLHELRISPYSFIGEFDALISDYSSVVFDYLLLDRPIGFDLTDFDLYNNGRGFSVEDPKEYMPGHHIYSEDDFIQFIRDVSAGIDVYDADRRRMCKLFNSYRDNQSSKRVLEYLGIVPSGGSEQEMAKA